ncbi:tetratricopeptide repeat protein [Pseudanabaena sp. FACHB-1998]|uniref:CHAT domain-containing protein n=1 Tax=Pseudanabaena sp. FACHB-1998 TaxID=2692858 RepID=UPI0016801E1D|nr:tetratricopeptide repeat protein [Pseudanabaena sp. FACHB-1998]MBD2175443.1 tetratricopeptide repeat protein [Pseudanabaena sp. FACHB-1998]
MIYPSVFATLFIAIAPIASTEIFAQELDSPKLIAQNSPEQPPSNPLTSDGERGFQLVIKAREQLQQGNTQEALTLFQQAIAIFQKQGDRYSEARTLNFIGNVYLDLTQFEKAIATYQVALGIVNQIKPSNPKDALKVRNDEVLILLNLGYTLNQASKQEEAVSIYEQALVGAQTIKDQEREATILNNLGQIYVRLGKISQGLERLQKALAIRQNSPDPALKKNLAGVLLNIGFTYRRLGQFDKALDFYQQSLGVAKKTGDRKVETSILNNIAGIYRSQGKYLKSLEQYQASLDLAQKLSLFSQEASTLSNIGTVYKELGQSANALKYFEQALQKNKKLKNRQFESVLLSNIGSIYDDQGKTQQALNYYQQALAIHQEINDIAAQGVTLNNIGEAYRTLKQYDNSLSNYQQALKILRELGDRSAEAVALANMGSIYTETKRYSESLTVNQQAVAIHRQLGERRGESIDLSNLGYLFLDWNKPELAILFFKQSVNVRESIRKDLRSLSVEAQKVYTGTVEKTYRDLANLLLKQNRLLEAQQVLDLLKIQELDDYLKNVRGNSETAKGIELLAPEQRFLTDYSAIQNRSIQAGEKLLDILKITPINRSPQQIQRLMELQDIQEQTSQQLNTYVQSPAVTTILKQISQSESSNSEATLQQFASLQKNLQQLSQKAAIFYPLILEDRLELILVTANGKPIRRTVPVKQIEFNQAIVDFRSEVRDPSSLDILDSAQKLHSWLIQPIASDLQQAGIQTIIYAPDGQLRYVPIAALHDGKQWLVERYAINTITAASLTNLSDRPSNKQPRVLAGAFTSGRYTFEVNGQTFSFAGLPFAEKEVENLVSKLPNSAKFIDRDFNVNSTVAKFQQFNIIHLATHAAFVIGKPEDSFVMFGDGSRASLRDVSTWSLKNVDLVILSACETGLGGKLGNGTEIMGFGYQMEYAGAKAAIASLWQVSDGGTQALMEAFYGVLKDSQLTKAEVLAKAQRAMIQRQSNTQDFSHPYFWSPFIIIGNGL